MASFAVPLFLTPPAQAIGRARRGATGMAGRVVLAWSGYSSAARRARAARFSRVLGVFAFWPDKGRQGGNGGWRSGGKGVRGRY